MPRFYQQQRKSTVGRMAPGQLSEQIRDAITPPKRARWLSWATTWMSCGRPPARLFNTLEDAIPAIGEPRLRAIARLCAARWSFNRLVATTGLSKTRVAQLVGEARAQG